MKKNYVVGLVCLIALAEFIYLGYQFRRSQSYADHDQQSENISVIASGSFKNDTAGGGKNEVQQGNSGAGGHMVSNNEEKVENRGRIESENRKINDRVATSDVKKDGLKPILPDHANNDFTKIDLLDLGRLVQQMEQNDLTAKQQVISIAKQTSDKHVLHKSLQSLGRVGGSDARQVLVDAVGNRLDNSIEVIRILSYIDRSAVLEEAFVDRLIQYLDSPSATDETKKVIERKVLVSGGNYGREKLADHQLER